MSDGVFVGQACGLPISLEHHSGQHSVKSAIGVCSAAGTMSAMVNHVRSLWNKQADAAFGVTIVVLLAVSAALMSCTDERKEASLRRLDYRGTTEDERTAVSLLRDALGRADRSSLSKPQLVLARLRCGEYCILHLDWIADNPAVDGVRVYANDGTFVDCHSPEEEVASNLKESKTVYFYSSIVFGDSKSNVDLYLSKARSAALLLHNTVVSNEVPVRRFEGSEH